MTRKSCAVGMRNARLRNHLKGTVEPRFNEVAGDRPNLFVKSRVRYIENLDITNLRGNDQNVRYIKVIVNDWFVTQVTSVTQFNAVFVSQKCRVLRCNSLSTVAFNINYFHFKADAQLLFTKEPHFQSSDLKMLQHRGYATRITRICWLLIWSAFIFCRVFTL